ncbi:hypothetical protein LEN26_008033 [Aphanomyces euteiches]|nr:hypothetical protein AeMF1_019291 [Aphanomyces euteiches]KAH9112259.1 hypothetical protein AeMF1_013336 [Aphanomyces euteiches]KAH9121623.1 hypothetical protein AeMF1_006739 [Aphanomyces euteiches]KAH9122158.1 hypothetical protein AeMF1_006444 [Aphanomyces euteiches]KAH9123535.1 hypothetical protein AeMF1_005488 [Aphanomyces euteiches]
MHILTWNINGLRAVLAKAGQTLDEFLAKCDADIICFQETKLTRSEMTEALACPKEFDAFYSFSRTKKGYSGVATFVRTSTRHTLAAETNLCPFQEGRLVVTVHGEFVVINVYCPATAGDVERKMNFHTFFTSEITRQRQSHPNKPFIIVGDLNVIHKPIDDCADYIECDATEWLDALLKDTPLVDAFRHFHPAQEKSFTCWRALTGARETNYGVRIDYILVDQPFLRNVGDDCWLWTSKVGSDHCPVILRLKDLEASGEPTTKTSLIPPTPKITPSCENPVSVFLNCGLETKICRFLLSSALSTPGSSS